MKFENLTFFTNTKQYFKRYLNQEIFAWYRVGKYYVVFLPFVIVAIIGLFLYINPFGPKVAILAIGQEGSSYGVLAKRYQSIFSDFGLTLELIQTQGLTEGVKSLNDPSSPVNASFVTAGFATSEQHPNLVSLGSVQYAPIWLFYKGEKINVDDPFEYFSNKKIGIGLPDTNSNKIFRELLESNQRNAAASTTLIELSHVESVRNLQEGKLDAIFIVDSFKAPVVQKLLNDQSIWLMSFNLADAYVKKFPFLHKLIVPKGSYDLEKIKPQDDIVLLSSTTNLLIEKKTHPAVQWAFMLAASEVGNYSEDFFSRPGIFPKYMDVSFPVSPVAKRYYARGEPVFFDYLPLWLASLIENIWVPVLAFIALIYPVYKWLAGFRTYPSKKFVYRNFSELRNIDHDISTVQNLAQAQLLLERLNQLNYYVHHVQWLSKSDIRFYFTQKNLIPPIQKKLEEKIDDLNKMKS